MKEKKESRVPAVYFESLNPKNLSLRVSLEDQAFDLSLKVSAQRNAAEYYEKAKKAEKKAKGAEDALKQTRIRIEEAKRRRLEETERMPKIPVPLLRGFPGDRRQRQNPK